MKRVSFGTLPAWNVERTRASLNKKATTKPNYLILYSSLLFLSSVGRYTSDGIATQDGLEHSGDRILVEGEIFRSPSRPTLGSTQSPVQYVPRFFPVGKAGGTWGSPQSTAEIKQRVELYVYSHAAPWWQILRGEYFFFWLAGIAFCVSYFSLTSIYVLNC